MRWSPPIGWISSAARRGVDDVKALCSGPGKLCQALGVTREHDGLALDLPPFRARGRVIEIPEIVTGPRIGITRGTELSWRYMDARLAVLAVQLRAGSRGALGTRNQPWPTTSLIFMRRAAGDAARRLCASTRPARRRRSGRSSRTSPLARKRRLASLSESPTTPRHDAVQRLREHERHGVVGREGGPSAETGRERGRPAASPPPACTPRWASEVARRA